MPQHLVKIGLPDGRLDVWAYGDNGRAVRLTTETQPFDLARLVDIDLSSTAIAKEIVSLVTLLSRPRQTQRPPWRVHLPTCGVHPL